MNDPGPDVSGEPLPRITQDVNASGGFAYGTIGADIHVHGDGRPVYLLEEHMTASGRAHPGWAEQPSRLLNARNGVVPFTGREAELSDLESWRGDAGGADTGPDTSSSRLSARWLHAAGGQGKTRLADAFARRSLGAGWNVLTAIHGPGSVHPPPGSRDLRPHGAKGVLVIVDYADRWPPSHLSWLFSDAVLHQRIPARLLLIARSASVWPAVRAALEAQQAETSARLLAALPDEPGGRQLMFNVARDAFARLYGVADPAAIRPPVSLDRPDFGLTLAIHMAALVAVDAAAHGEQLPEDVAGLTTYLLDRERRHWTRMYENRVEGLEFDTRPATMARAVFTAALTGAISYRDGAAVLTQLDPGGQVPQLLDDHAVCYPPAARETALEPLYPDRLAEDYLALALPGHDESRYSPDPWTADVPEALLVHTESSSDSDHAPRAVVFLAAAADRWPHVGIRHLFPLLGREPALALRAGSAALTTLAELVAVPIDLLDAIAAHFPAGKHPDLDAGMAAVTRRLAALQIRATRDPARRVSIHRGLAIRLSHAGLDQEALDVLRDALPDIRHLAAVSPARHESGLAQILEDLAKAFRQVGLIDQAIAAAEESMDILQRLAADAPDAHEKALAQTTHTLAVSLQHTRRRDDTPGALLRKTVEIYRRLAETDPQFQQLHLVAALDDLGRYKRDTGRPQEAVALFRESLEVARRLASADPAACDVEVARVLGNLSTMLCQAGQFEEAARTAEEAVKANRRLATANPAAYDYPLGLALDALATACWRVNRRDEALASSAEAIEIFRRLAGANVARESNLAASLANHGVHLSQIPGCWNEALVAAEEAAIILRRVPAEGPVSYEHELAMALHVQAVAAGLAGKTSALDIAGEGIAIRRRLALANPDAYDFYLASELFGLAHITGRAARPREARALLEEAIGIARRLAESHPDVRSHVLSLAQGLIALARVSMAVPGGYEQAREASTEAVRLLTPLAGQQEALRPFLEEASEIRLIEDCGRRCGPGRDGSESGRSVERSRLAWLLNRLLPCWAGLRTTCWLAGASPWCGSKEARAERAPFWY